MESSVSGKFVNICFIFLVYVFVFKYFMNIEENLFSEYMY